MPKSQSRESVASSSFHGVTMPRFIGFNFGYAFSIAVLITVCLTAKPLPLFAQSQELDSDKDGLSDFHEKFKYFTDPQNSDSDGDGTLDGDWLERREYQYTIRTVVQVLRPVTPEYLNDDYQDARVLDATDDYVELEVIHYPFNKVADSISANENWREESNSLRKWIEPGPSNDWTPELREELVTKLKAAGINVDELNDKHLVEQASRWLCNHAKYDDGFTAFLAAWDKTGKPYVPEALLESASQKISHKNIDLPAQLEREVSAAGMFKHQQRGSCTSSAIYLNGCLKALGIPTRTILCIPIIDAGDDREMAMLDNIQQTAVRDHLKRSLLPLKNSWASHTFNEVYVGGRWRRLNYNKLGQGIYDENLYGLITHVATVNDWADAKAHETIGVRQANMPPKDIFGGNNPYSTISLRDQVGEHCQLTLPEPAPAKPHVVEKIYWTDDESLPESIRENCKRNDRFGLIAVVSGCGAGDEFRSFLSQADLRASLTPTTSTDAKSLSLNFDPGCFWIGNGTAYIYVRLEVEGQRELSEKTEYSFRARSSDLESGWILEEDFKVTRTTEANR